MLTVHCTPTLIETVVATGDGPAVKDFIIPRRRLSCSTTLQYRYLVPRRSSGNHHPLGSRRVLPCTQKTLQIPRHTTEKARTVYFIGAFACAHVTGRAQQGHISRAAPTSSHSPDASKIPMGSRREALNVLCDLIRGMAPAERLKAALGEFPQGTDLLVKVSDIHGTIVVCAFREKGLCLALQRDRIWSKGGRCPMLTGPVDGIVWNDAVSEMGSG